MKEYICKEDMSITINDKSGNRFYFEIPLSTMDGLLTLTKADICIEFAERIKEMFDFCGKNAMGIIDVDIAKGLVDKVLSEMEDGG